MKKLVTTLCVFALAALLMWGLSLSNSVPEDTAVAITQSDDQLTADQIETTRKTREIEILVQAAADLRANKLTPESHALFVGKQLREAINNGVVTREDLGFTVSDSLP